MAVTMRKYAEELLAAARKHMMDTALSAGSFVAARRLLRLSYRKLQWLRRLLSHDGKEPRVMHPKYSTRVPVNPSIPEMKVEEASMLESEGDITQQEDGFGAHCADLDRAISKAIGVRAVRGELSRSGSESERHIIIWAGDGFMARKKSKWVQFGVIVGSVTGMNQSPSDVRFVMNYRGGEEYDVLNIRTDVFRAVMQRITREGCVRDEHGEIPAGVGKYVEFAIGGDKPWIMTVLGRRNMNHTYFSPSCRCTRENISCLTCDQDTHYEVDADQACRDSHVCPEMHFRGGAFVPFTCRCCGVVFKSEADVVEEEDRMLALEPTEFKVGGEKFSLSHGGRFWNSPPIFPYKHVFSDPLHLFLNLFNVAFDESVDFYLRHEYVSADSKVLLCDISLITTQVNLILKKGGLVARFGTEERKALCGNDIRCLMAHEAVLPDILHAMRPLYWSR